MSKQARARSFGDTADDYDRARPGYPAEAVEWLLGTRPLDVIDVGAGTGKLTAILARAGHRVTAVEPLAPLRRKLSQALPAVRATSGRAERLPLDDAAADAVVVGQAFHWFDARAAVGEISRVLRPAGVLGLIWNFRDESQRWMRELTTITGADGLPDGWTVEREVLPRVASASRRDFRLEHPVDRERLLALVRSWSYVATLAAAEHKRVLARVHELWDAHPDLAGTSSAVLTYRTEAYKLYLT
jgi:SAM-dependent methyltransferase